MTPHMPVVTSDDLVRVAKRLGYVFDRQKGSHAVYYRDSDKSRVVIPIHKGKSIKPKTLAGILQDMGIGAEDLRRLM